MQSKINTLKENLKSNPNNFNACNELALIFFQKQKYIVASDYFLRALKIKKDNKILEKLSHCFMKLDDYKKAINIFEKLIKNNFVSDFILNSYGVALKETKKYLSALEIFNHGLKINPTNHLIYYNMANLFVEVSEFNKAKENYKKCLEINEKFYPAMINLGSLNLKQKDTEEAIKNLNKVNKYLPKNKVIIENLAKVYLVKKLYKKSEFYFKELLKIDPNSIDKIIPVIQGYTYIGDDSNYQKLSKFYSEKLSNKSSIYLFNQSQKKKIKIGLVSPDIRNHPIGFFIKDLLPELAKKLEIKIYNTGIHKDNISDHVKKFSEWHESAKIKNEQLSQKIFDDKIDVLFDMSGLTKGNKLSVFKLKPSSKQITWAGWLATTNLKQMDYIIGDNFATPKKDKKNFVEKIYRMENTWCVYSKSEFDKVKIFKNESQNIVFGCFQRPEKLNKKVLTTWSKILLRKKDSFLFFNNGMHQNYDVKNIFTFFTKMGVSSSRIRFAKSRNRLNYLNSYNLVDINLDTFPYNGGTTSFESVFMGIPILTMRNESIMFRCGESINSNLNMVEWIAKNEDEYVEKAISFSNKKLIKSIKNKLVTISKKSPLFDPELFSRNFFKMINGIL